LGFQSCRWQQLQVQPLGLPSCACGPYLGPLTSAWWQITTQLAYEHHTLQNISSR
jgi:hypothetical protein